MELGQSPLEPYTNAELTMRDTEQCGIGVWFAFDWGNQGPHSSELAAQFRAGP